MRERIPCVYIMASGRNGTLYVGVTSDLLRRVEQHKRGTADGFTKRYGIQTLVYYEVAETMRAAIEREKQLKGGSRAQKVALIEKGNPLWRDLTGEL